MTTMQTKLSLISIKWSWFPIPLSSNAFYTFKIHYSRNTNSFRFRDLQWISTHIKKPFHIPCSSAQNSTSWPQPTFLALSLKILVSEYFVPTRFFYSLLLMPLWHSAPLALEYLQLLSWLVLIVAFQGWLKCQVNIYIMCVSSTL